MTRWLRRFWIWLNTPPIDVIAPPDFELRRKQLENAAISTERWSRR